MSLRNTRINFISIRSLLARHIVPISLTLAALMIAIGGDTTAQLFQYQRNLILDGEVWRLITAHLVHLTWSHMLLNLAGLLLIWLLFGNYYANKTWLVIVLISCVGPGIGLLLFDPNLIWYVGLSGMLHGLFVAGCVAEIKLKQRGGWVLLAVICSKLTWEQFYGPLPGSAEAAGGDVIVDAHLYGALSGILSLFLNLKNARIKIKNLSET